MRRFILSSLFCWLAFSALSISARAGDDWLPVTQEELKMTSEPKAPGAAAIYLYRQVDRNDDDGHEHVYVRIKIFTEEGRKYADVEIPFVKQSGTIDHVQARTIHADGSIINFDGKTYDKMVVKAKGMQFLAKTFSLPDVQPGCIIEYRYSRTLPFFYVYDSEWILSEELFTKHAKFSLSPSKNLALSMSWRRGLPQGATPPVKDHHGVHMEIQDVPAFQIEDYMPPEDELKYRVDFMYTHSVETDPERFWKQEAQSFYRGIETFTDKRKAMEQAVAQIISPTDTPEQKLHKIYARCQTFRNISIENAETKQERDREKLKDIENVEDMWKRGYGNNRQINWLFLALVRAAGFDASPVFVSTRDKYFFTPKLMRASDLDSSVVLVKLTGKDLYFSPGVAFAPFGLLPWNETGVPGLRMEKDGGTWITTPLVETSASGIERKARLHLDDSGSLEGTATLTFKGLSALWRRIDEHEEDAAERKAFLEREMKGYIPASAEAELTNKPDWDSAADTLVAEYHIKVPGWTSAAGHRTLLPVGLFSAGEKHVFEHAARVHPVYYHYAYQDHDDITIELPPGWQISSLPKSTNIDGKLCAYKSDAQNASGALHLNREFTVNILMLDARYYAALRNFYQQVSARDEEQVVLSGSEPAVGN